jgi:hypothetical protein
VDRGLTWVESDTSNRKLTDKVTTSSDKYLITVTSHRHLIYVAHNNVVKVEQFSMNENAWGATIATGGPTIVDPGVGGDARMFLECRTDGSFVLLYTDQESVFGSMYGRVRYVTLTGSTWSSENNITAHGASDFVYDRPHGIIRGASNRVHMFFTTQEAPDYNTALYHVSLSSAGALDTYAELGGNARCHQFNGNDTYQPVGVPLFTNSKVMIPFLRYSSSSDDVIVSTAPSQANPTFTNEVPPNLSNSVVKHYCPTRNRSGAILSISKGSTSIGIFQTDDPEDTTGPDFIDYQIHYLDLPVVAGDEDEVFLFIRFNSDSLETSYYYSRRSIGGTWGTPLFVYAAIDLKGVCAGPTEDCVHPPAPAGGRMRYAGVGLT